MVRRRRATSTTTRSARSRSASAIATKCPKCGRKSFLKNAVSMWCPACGFQIVDPDPLPTDRDERRRRMGLK